LFGNFSSFSDKLYNINTSIFTKDYTDDKEDELTKELNEQKSRTLRLQKSLDEQRELLSSISTELQRLTGASSPFILRGLPLDDRDMGTSHGSSDANSQRGSVTSTLPPSLL